jgi:hypothetical protein
VMRAVGDGAYGRRAPRADRDHVASRAAHLGGARACRGRSR